ncbi:hypothetical protein N9X12_05125 [Alphaproteobacteria bacterium]|nr:hypothetical protein [Alphaproteobacteria bacterium]
MLLRELQKCRKISPSLLAAMTLLATGMIAAPTVSAETRIESAIGTVIQSDALTTSYIRETPTDQRTCRNENVPIYGKKEEQSSDLGAMIIGGLIGSAVGNKMSDNNGAGAAGTVAGALLGREHAKKNQAGQKIVGYNQQEVCSVQTIMIKENIEKVTGYRNQIEVDGRTITLETSTPLSNGARVEIRKSVTYSLR